jgi:TorA maturation chaperone TorD
VKSLLLRAEALRLLALALRHPAPDVLREELESLPDELAELRALAPFVDGDLPFEHTRLFAQSTPVSPYEGSYVRTDKGVLLGQLAALYELFGVRVGAEREPPDHMGCQLEFAALLALKQALSLRDGAAEHAEVAARARQVLCEEHLGRWVGEFSRRLRELARHPFYVALAELLPVFVARDLALEGWHAEPLDARSCLPVLDPDALTCPMSERQDLT